MSESNHFSFEVYASLEQILDKDWEIPGLTLPFYARHDFLAIIEKLHEKQFKFRYVIIKEQGKVCMLVCFEIIHFKGKNILPFIRKMPDSKIKRLLFYLFKLLIGRMSWNILSTGNTFLTGDNGIYAADYLTNETKIKLLQQAFQKAQDNMFCRLSLKMMNNIYDQSSNGDRFINEFIKIEDFASFPIEPDMVLTLSNCKCYEDYKNSLSSKYRVRANKVDSVSNKVEIKNLSLEEIKEFNPLLNNLYRNVAQNVAFNIGLLSEHYFIEMKSRFPEHFYIDAYFLNGEMVAFYSYFTCNYMLVHFMGMNYNINPEMKLYNRMLLDMVKKGIEWNFSEIHFGRTATEIKSTIGAKPRSMHIHLHHQRNYFHKRMKKLEETFGAPDVVIRNPFKE